MTILNYLKNFLDLRLRAFVYALFTLNGFILGMIVHNGMAVASIEEFGKQTRAAIMEQAK